MTTAAPALNDDELRDTTTFAIVVALLLQEYAISDRKRGMNLLCHTWESVQKIALCRASVPTPVQLADVRVISSYFKHRGDWDQIVHCQMHHLHYTFDGVRIPPEKMFAEEGYKHALEKLERIRTTIKAVEAAGGVLVDIRHA